MNSRGLFAVLCFSVLLRVTMGVSGFELELILSKMDFLQYRLQEIEQNMKATIEKVGYRYSKFETRMNMLEQSLQKSMNDKLQGVEETIKASMEQAVSSLKEMEQDSKHKHTKLEDTMAKFEKDRMERDLKSEKKMQAMERSLKESVAASEENTRIKLEELKNHMIPKIDRIQQTSQTELKKLGENKEILDVLTNSIHNFTTNADTCSKTLQGHLKAPIRSCRQVTRESGTYLFRLWEKSEPFEVFCVHNTFEGGWTVIQHRFDGSIDFYRNWTEYRNGFGTMDGEFWLGLEYVYQMTKNRPHELLVEVKDFHGNYGYAKYEEFEIGNESEQYKLKKLGTYSGTAEDSMQSNRYAKFSTFDYIKYEWEDYNNAERFHGGWWYWNYTDCNLNGRYQNTTDDNSAMTWFYLKYDQRGMSYSRMMIRDIVN